MTKRCWNCGNFISSGEYINTDKKFPYNYYCARMKKEGTNSKINPYGYCAFYRQKR